MRWRIESGLHRRDDDVWGFTLSRGRRSRHIRAYVTADAAELRGGSQESVAVNLVEQHLDDDVTPDQVSLSSGWDFERKQTVTAEFEFTHLAGLRMRMAELARRLNLPHWLHPRP